MSSITSKGKILVVDDSALNLRLAQSLLETNGYQVETLSDPHQVLPRAITSEPDLILLDIMMPVLSGIEVCKELKKNPKTSPIPVIFLTAKVSQEDIVEGLAAGAGDYVTKPFRVEELIARIQVHAQLFQNQKSLAEKNRQIEQTLNEIAKLSHAMLKVCAWTKQVEIDGKWIPIEEYLSQHLGINLTHGISKDGLIKFQNEEQL